MSLRLIVESDFEFSYSASLDEQGKCLKFEVSRLHTVPEICLSLYGRLKPELQHDIQDFGLYFPEKKTWLKDKLIGRELRGLNSAQLQFRLKMRPVRIRFLDASSKTFMINESLTVKEIVADVCSQLSLDHPEELSLVVAIDYAVNKHHPANQGEPNSPLLSPKKDFTSPNSEVKSATSTSSPRVVRKRVNSGRPGSASGRPGSASGRPGSAGMFGRKRSASGVNSAHMKKQISRKHQIRIDTPWLDPNKSLREQDVTEEDELLMMYRFHYNMEIDRDSTAVEILYKQARATFLAREMLCPEEDIPKFTALLCQIVYGDFISKEDTQDKLHKLKKVLLPAKIKSKTYSKEVASFHLLLSGLSAQEAKCWFVKLWSSMTLFGMEFISCTNWETKERGLIGISKEKVIFLHHNTKKKSVKLDMNSLSSWELDSECNVVTLYFLKDGVKLLLHFFGFYSTVFTDCLQGNREISADIPEIHWPQKEYLFDEELETRYSRYSHPTFTHPDVQKVGSLKRHKRSGSFTFNDVLHWGEDVETPLVSNEEKSSWKTESWENPLYEDLDRLMDERFSFLDFEESEKSADITGIVAAPADKVPVNVVYVVTSSPDTSPSSERLTNISSSPQITPVATKLAATKDSTYPASSPSPLLRAVHSQTKYTDTVQKSRSVTDITESKYGEDIVSPLLSHSASSLKSRNE